MNRTLVCRPPKRELFCERAHDCDRTRSLSSGSAWKLVLCETTASCDSSNRPSCPQARIPPDSTPMIVAIIVVPTQASARNNHDDGFDHEHQHVVYSMMFMTLLSLALLFQSRGRPSENLQLCIYALAARRWFTNPLAYRGDSRYAMWFP